MEQDILKIVVTGPESSGKTLLAEDLAAGLQLNGVPEFARYYVAHLGRQYLQEDLITMYKGQQVWENWFMEKTKRTSLLPALVCDTDWTVIRVWEQYGYKTPSVLPEMTKWEQQPNSIYLLCSPDFPWEPDPLREHPEERWQLFELYRKLLDKRKLNYIVLQGAHARRLQTAELEIQKLLRPLQQ